MIELNKIKIETIFFTTKCLAYISLYYLKFIELVLRLVLKLPNSTFSYVTNCRPIINNLGEKISLICAKNEYGDITDKFRLFLKIYFERATVETPFDDDGFDVSVLHRLLDCGATFFAITDQKEIKYITTHKLNNSTNYSAFEEKIKFDEEESKPSTYNELNFDSEVFDKLNETDEDSNQSDDEKSSDELSQSGNDELSQNDENNQLYKRFAHHTYADAQPKHKYIKKQLFGNHLDWNMQ